MKKTLLAVALLMGIGLTTPMPAAAHSSVSFGFWFPGVSLFVAPPAPVYYAPPVYAPPVYYYPYAPVYAPGAVVVGGYGWGYGHRYYRGGGYRYGSYGRGRGHWKH